MEFTKDFLQNKLFYDQALTFDRMPDKRDSASGAAGAHILPNGDVRFRIEAANANEVVIKTDKEDFPLAEQADGSFEGVMPYSEKRTGCVTAHVVVDGTVFVYPYLPVYWTSNRPCNFVEVPDHALEFCMVKNVPHGTMSHEVYWSNALQDWARCTIYTPPGYTNGADSYPVLYLLNGGGDNEICWEYSGRLPYIMDNLLAETDCAPFIIVMNNGMLREGGNVSIVRDRAFDKLLTEDCIPYIENRYRVKTGKWNRAIAGLSMGSYMTSDISCWHADLFGYVGHFTASMTHTEIQATYERPYPAFMAEIKKNPAVFGELFNVFYRSTTPNEDHMEFFEADDAILAEAGVDALPCYHRNVYPPSTSKWNSWRMGLRDFAQLIFR